MGLLDKISNLIFEEEQSTDNIDKKTTTNAQKKNRWTDVFYESTSKDNNKKKKKFTDIFYESSSTESHSTKRRSILDFLYEESEETVHSTFVENEEETILNDIPSQIKRRESILINLGEFFKTVKPEKYPDSVAEYNAYLSLIKQLNEIKDLLKADKNSPLNSMNEYQLNMKFKQFESDYAKHINSIKSLCYLSELNSLNTEMRMVFNSNLTKRMEDKIAETDRYITLISDESNIFNKKYSSRLYKELIDAEYILTILKLMIGLKHNKEPRKNPFSSFSEEKKSTFESYISRDIREANEQYNTIADNRERYVKYSLVTEETFIKLDSVGEILSSKINQYTIDDFLLSELFDDGEGYDTLKRFLRFKLRLNFIDTKTKEADERALDDDYRRAKSQTSCRKRNSQSTRKFPDFDEDL